MIMPASISEESRKYRAHSCCVLKIIKFNSFSKNRLPYVNHRDINVADADHRHLCLFCLFVVVVVAAFLSLKRFCRVWTSQNSVKMSKAHPPELKKFMDKKVMV